MCTRVEPRAGDQVTSYLESVIPGRVDIVESLFVLRVGHLTGVQADVSKEMLCLRAGRGHAIQVRLIRLQQDPARFQAAFLEMLVALLVEESIRDAAGRGFPACQNLVEVEQAVPVAVEAREDRILVEGCPFGLPLKIAGERR